MRCFNKNIINELKTKLKLMVEMKIQSNLFWDKHTGELNGYVDSGDTELNYAALEKLDNIATYLLAFLIRSIVNSFKYCLANFSTSGASANQMLPFLWKAISTCELNSLKVLAASCNGVSPNRNLRF